MKFNHLFVGLLLFIIGCNSKTNNNSMHIQNEKSQDSCRLNIRKHENGVKFSEGIICNGLRKGIWKEWYANGTLMDSGYYISGCRIYNDSLLKKIKGTVTFKNNPRKFIVDSTYFFSVTLNQSYHFSDIRPDWLNFKTEDGRMYKFQRFDFPLDSFCFVFTPLKKGHIKFILALSKKTINHSELYPFYQRDIDISEK